MTIKSKRIMVQALLEGEKFKRINSESDIRGEHTLSYAMDVQQFIVSWANGDRCAVDINLVEAVEWKLIEPTININGYEVPYPMKIRDQEYSLAYYYVALNAPDGVQVNNFTNTELDKRYFERGLVHPTRDDAYKHAQALLSFTKDL